MRIRPYFQDRFSVQMTRHFYLRRFNSRCITCLWATALQCNCMFYTSDLERILDGPVTTGSLLFLVSCLYALLGVGFIIFCTVMGVFFLSRKKHFWTPSCRKWRAIYAAVRLSHSWDYYTFLIGSGGLTD